LAAGAGGARGGSTGGGATGAEVPAAVLLLSGWFEVGCVGGRAAGLWGAAEVADARAVVREAVAPLLVQVVVMSPASLAVPVCASRRATVSACCSLRRALGAVLPPFGRGGFLIRRCVGEIAGTRAGGRDPASAWLPVGAPAAASVTAAPATISVDAAPIAVAFAPVSLYRRLVRWVSCVRACRKDFGHGSVKSTGSRRRRVRRARMRSASAAASERSRAVASC
jgi:hypothetical protein